MNDITSAAYYGEDVATLGDRIVAAREAKEFSQEDLSRRLGVKLNTVQSWESDHAEPRGNKAQMLSGVIGVTIMWLLTGEGDGAPEPRTDDGKPTTLKDVLDDIRKLNSELSQQVCKLSSLEKRLRRAV
jgi:ribosome-binding protein aMBF1 (putative translation factor)